MSSLVTWPRNLPRARDEARAGLFAGCGGGDGDWYEYAVLVTSWEQSEVRVLAQAYWDRAALRATRSAVLSRQLESNGYA
jgi:hypothetical protein